MPVDDLVDDAGRLITLGVVEVATRLAIDSASFDRADFGELSRTAANLLRAAGLSISAETLRTITENEGKLVVAAQRCEQLELDFTTLNEPFKASECVTESTPDGTPVTRVYLGTDGVMDFGELSRAVPMTTDAEKHKRREKAVQKRRRLPRRKDAHRPALPRRKRGSDQSFKEFKIVHAYDQPRKHRYVRATRHDHRHAGKLIRMACSDVRLRAADERVGLSDGASWIARQIDANAPCVQHRLDFYHLSQHVHQTRRVLFGEEGGHEWIEDLLHTVKHEGYDPFWEKLVQTRTQSRSRTKRKSLDELMHYVSARREMIDYPDALARGQDIGSGPTESMCKALTQRLKRRGMRWDSDNAEAIMALETLEQTDRWAAWLRIRSLLRT